jgi:class 3 adenylate cyclase
MQRAGDRVDRRLAAILVANVVGYSRLMAADETGTAVYCARGPWAAAGALIRRLWVGYNDGLP